MWALKVGIIGFLGASSLIDSSLPQLRSVEAILPDAQRHMLRYEELLQDPIAVLLWLSHRMCAPWSRFDHMGQPCFEMTHKSTKQAERSRASTDTGDAFDFGEYAAYYIEERWKSAYALVNHSDLDLLRQDLDSESGLMERWGFGGFPFASTSTGLLAPAPAAAQRASWPA